MVDDHAPLIELSALARRIAVAALIVAALAGVAVPVAVRPEGLVDGVWAWSGLVLMTLGPIAVVLTAASALAGVHRARQRGEPLRDRPGFAPPQLRRR